MNLIKNVFLLALFFLLSPNILFRLPGNKYVSALLHGALFALVWYVSNPVLEGIDAKAFRRNKAAQTNTSNLSPDQIKVVQAHAQGTQVQIQNKK